MPLYFAYGSNLKRDRLEGRLKRALGPASHAVLRDHRLAFHKRGDDGFGRASIVDAPRHVVFGVLYELSDDDLDQLDGFEGVPNGHYRRVVIDVDRVGGVRVAATTYVAEADRVDDTLRPSTTYLGIVVDGAREHGLSARAIAAIEAAARGESPATEVVAAVAQDPGPNGIALGNDMKHEERARRVLAALSKLQWAGKAEHTSFEVDTVSLHIHERVSTQAILRAVKRDAAEPQMNLFARPELPAAKEVDFYSHDVGWSNRLVLGDSLTVMNSLLERENMAGQVQARRHGRGLRRAQRLHTLHLPEGVSL